MNNPKGKSIYVLYGVAGIGKSTVAKTVAEHAANDNALGASFFFSRNEDNRKSAKSLFPTLAYHLSCHYPVLADRINTALNRGSEPKGKDLVRQFDRLIARPLQKPLQEVGRILLVLDALDECDAHDAGTVLSLFVQNVSQIPQLRILLAARPEMHIRAVFERYRDHEQFHLHDIDELIVEADIRSYIEFRFSASQVLKALPDLRSPIWQPTRKQKDALVGMSGKLFIIAATVASFILDPKRANPAKQLATLLDGVSLRDFSGSKHNTVMDKVYTEIIRAAQPDPIGNWADQFKDYVGTIVLLHDPLPCDAVAELIGVEIDEVTATLSNLHSLLAPSVDNRIFRIHHKSLPDFITDPGRCKDSPEYWIDRKAHHLRMAERCLRVMDIGLRMNLCNLEPNEWHKSRAKILHRIQHGVSHCLAYACTYWAPHMEAALRDETRVDSEVLSLLGRFASRHLLTWLEALSIVGRMDTAYSSLDIVRTIGRRVHLPNIAQELFDDACRLVQRTYIVIHSFPMQIYKSALPFSPRNSTLFRTYGGLHTNNVDVIFGLETDWNPVISVLRGHSGSVRCVAFSADGSRLASGSEDRTIRLWDGRTGHNIATLKGHAGTVLSLMFSADDSILASASSDGIIKLWDGGTGHQVTTLRGHSGEVYVAAFSAGGSRLASLAVPQDNTIQLRNGGTGHFIATLQGHSGSVVSVVFSPDGSILASASNDRTVRLWDSETGCHITTLSNCCAFRSQVAFSPDGSRIALEYYQNTIRLWEPRTHRHTATLKGHCGSANSLAFSRDGSRFVSGSDDRMIRLWDGRTGAYIASLGAHFQSVRSVTFSPDSSRLASASDDNTVRIWDTRTIGHISGSGGRSDLIDSVMFSPDGSRIALAGHDGTVQVRDGWTGKLTATLNSHSNGIRSMVFSADSSRIASACYDGTLRLWDNKTGRYTNLENHSGPVNFVMFSADGSTLVAAYEDRIARLWDSRTGRCIATLVGHSGAVISAAFSSDGLRLVSASRDGTTMLWNTRTKTPIANLQGHSNSVESVSFSADGSTLASASWDGTVQLWDGRTGRHIATLDRRYRGARSAVFSVDGSRLISTYEDHAGLHLGDSDSAAQPSMRHTVLLWDVSNVARPHLLCRKTAVVVYNTARNCLFFLETRAEPALCGLTVLSLQDKSSFDTQVICWFPPDLSPRSLSVHPAGSIAAVVYDEGEFLVLDLSKCSIP